MEATLNQMTASDLQILIQRSVSESLQQIKADIRQPIPDKIDVYEVSRMTGLRRSVIYVKTSRKQIPHAKFGKRLVFSRHEIERWMESRTVRPVSADEKMSKHLSGLARNRK